MLFCLVFYFVITLGVQLEDYYVYMNAPEPSANSGASSSGGGYGNPNPNHKPNDYSKLGSTSPNKEDEDRGENLAPYPGKDTLTSDSFR
jgi:hypothetical protein